MTERIYECNGDYYDDRKEEHVKCDWVGAHGQMNQVAELIWRIAPGEIMPLGQCPKCGNTIPLPDDELEDWLLRWIVGVAISRWGGETY